MKYPRILISSTSSSSGKTTIVCALLQKYMTDYKNGILSLPPSSIKIGPDYIDPLFHSNIIGNKTGNIDLFFNDKDSAVSIFAQDAKDSSITICEGAMGYYDGKGGNSENFSSYEAAKSLGCPVILVVDVKGRSFSLCAEINGFTKFRETDGDRSLIKGVILNRCSHKLYEKLKPVIEKECLVECLGYALENKEYTLDSRHLGLVTPQDISNIKNKLSAMSEDICKTIDTDRIFEIASEASEIKCDGYIKDNVKSCVRIGVAKDRAFCFYYRENLELLRSLGAELVCFSPLNDKKLPDNLSGLYIGGGYPELHVDLLSQNSSMAQSIKSFAAKGAPVYAECGGFMYLQMIGLLKGTFSNTGHLVRFGYIDLISNTDTFLMKKGESIKAHEFHYFDSTENGTAFTAVKDSNTRWTCFQYACPEPYMHNSKCNTGKVTENILAGFPHMYFPSNPDIAQNFIIACLQYESVKDINTGCGGCCSSKSSDCASCSGCSNCQKGKI